MRMRVRNSHIAAPLFSRACTHGWSFCRWPLSSGLRLPRFTDDFRQRGQAFNSGSVYWRREKSESRGWCRAFLTAHQRIVAVRRIRRIGHQRREIVSKDVSPFRQSGFLSPVTRSARTQKQSGSWAGGIC